MNDHISFENIHLPITYDNKITIELFDKLTGKKVEEVKTHNVITNGVAKMAYLDRYFYRLKNGCNPTDGNSGGVVGTNAGGALLVPYPNPFNVLSLYNSGLPENVNQKVILGTKIGYAEKSVAYAGSDILRGTVNLTETNFNEPNNCHYVFDFATSVANGTFDTLYWGAYSSNVFDAISPFSTWNSVNYVTNIFCSYNGIVSTVYNSSIKEFTCCFFKAGTYNRMVDLTSVIGTSNYINGICVDANNVYIITTNNKIYKLDKNYNLVSTITVSNLPTGYSEYTGGGGGLCFYNGNFYTILYKSNSNYLLAIINGSGVITLTKDIGSYAYKTINVCDSIMYILNGTASSVNLMLDANTLEKIGNLSPHTLTSLLNVSNSQMYYDLGKQYWVAGADYSGSNYNNPTPCYLVPPGAMAHVNPSITKTNTNTMKITYDFNIEIPIF